MQRLIHPLVQDIISYNLEQRSGSEGHNLVTLTMHEQGINIQDAINLLCEQHKDLQKRFLEAYRAFEILEWDTTINAQLRGALRDLAHFPRGIHCWHFECGRYFGNSGMKVGVPCKVELLPRAPVNKDLRQENVTLFIVDEV